MNPFDFDKFTKNVFQMREAMGLMQKYVKAGFPNVSEDIFNKRKSICESCEFWDKNGWFGYGKCGKCGCSGKKLWIAVANCPIQKWEKENIDTK